MDFGVSQQKKKMRKLLFALQICDFISSFAAAKF
jgi:hypothetical protein